MPICGICAPQKEKLSISPLLLLKCKCFKELEHIKGKLQWLYINAETKTKAKYEQKRKRNMYESEIMVNKFYCKIPFGTCD